MSNQMPEQWKAETTCGTAVNMDFLNELSRTVSNIMGVYKCKEIIDGVYEHTLTAPRTFIPALYADALMRRLIDDLAQSPLWKAHVAHMRQRRANYKRKVKQRRAAFRWRKRGLA